MAKQRSLTWTVSLALNTPEDHLIPPSTTPHADYSPHRLPIRPHAPNRQSLDTLWHEILVHQLLHQPGPVDQQTTALSRSNYDLLGQPRRCDEGVGWADEGGDGKGCGEV